MCGLFAAAVALLFAACAEQEGSTPLTAEMRAAALAAIEQGEMPAWRDWLFESTERGVRYVELAPGTGRSPDWGSRVRIHYHLWLTDGRSVDSSLVDGTGRPFEFTVGEGRVIAGWENVIRYLRVGGRYLVVVPPELGYGRQGTRDIPRSARLVFSMEVVGFR